MLRLTRHAEVVPLLHIDDEWTYVTAEKISNPQICTCNHTCILNFNLNASAVHDICEMSTAVIVGRCSNVCVDVFDEVRRGILLSPSFCDIIKTRGKVNVRLYKRTCSLCSCAIILGRKKMSVSQICTWVLLYTATKCRTRWPTWQKPPFHSVMWWKTFKFFEKSWKWVKENPGKQFYSHGKWEKRQNCPGTLFKLSAVWYY